MGKDLKGKELGVGIVQQANGLYVARFTDKHGRRQVCVLESRSSEE